MHFSTTIQIFNILKWMAFLTSTVRTITILVMLMSGH